MHFNKNDILNIKTELHKLNFGNIILIHKNKITFVRDYDDKYMTHIINNNSNEPYEDDCYFSFFDSNNNNNLLDQINAVEELSLSFSITDDIVDCTCERIEIDPTSIMYDQFANGSFKFHIQNGKFIYISGKCEDKYGDYFGIRSDNVVDVLNVISKYWKC